MRLIGLCGRSGSGKSECSRYIAEMGFAVIDSDMVYRTLTEKGSPLLRELTEFYGAYILNTSGDLDRKKLGSLVFGDDALLLKLNKITHKHIYTAILQWAEEVSANNVGGFAVVQAPLLFESELDKRCALKVCVLAPEEQCLLRLQTRDGLTEEEAKIRLSKQKSNSFLMQNCDYSIVNDGDIDQLRERTSKVFLKILGGVNDKD